VIGGARGHLGDVARDEPVQPALTIGAADAERAEIAVPYQEHALPRCLDSAPEVVHRPKSLSTRAFLTKPVVLPYPTAAASCRGSASSSIRAAGRTFAIRGPTRASRASSATTASSAKRTPSTSSTA